MSANVPPASRFPLAVSLFLATALWAYILLRAIKVGFTHDESSSFMNLIHERLRDVFFNERNWQAANNHLLNTLCMQIGHHFFGAQEWALRWGSLVAGALFLAYAFRLVRLWLPASSWFFFGAFCLLVLNHFVLDFFSLARGYGWCVAFEMAALFYFFRWLQTEQTGDVFKISLALALGILANFTLLDVLAAFFVTITTAFYLKNNRQLHWGKWFRLTALSTLPLLAALVLIFQPMRWIRAKGEFEYGPQGFWETWRILVERFVYNPLPAHSWWKVSVLVLATLLFLALAYSLFKRFKTDGLGNPPALFYASLLTVTTMLATVAQHYLLGANYLSGRTALLFYPLLAVVVVLYLIDLQKRWPRARFGWQLATGFVILNFCCQLNLRYALEWQYDENTEAALRFADQHSDPVRKLNYGVGWLYYSTTLFYQQTRAFCNVRVVQYNASHDDLAWVRSQPFDLIYVEEKLRPAVEDRYSLLQGWDQGVIMQKK